MKEQIGEKKEMGKKWREERRGEKGEERMGGVRRVRRVNIENGGE